MSKKEDEFLGVRAVHGRAYAGAKDGWVYAERGGLDVVVEMRTDCKSGILRLTPGVLRRLGFERRKRQ